MQEHRIEKAQREFMLSTLENNPSTAGNQLDREIRRRVLKAGQKHIDTPIRSTEEDAFSFSKIAKDWCNDLVRPDLETPFTLMIDGDWGVGKSSLARLIYYRLLEGDLAPSVGCLPVWIDSSMIDGPEQVLAVVAEGVRLASEIIAKRILTIPGKKGKFEPHIHPLAPISHGATESSSRRRRIEKHLRTDAMEWLKAWSSIDSVEWGFTRFRRLVQSVRYSLLGRGGRARLVLFIDDLDRCHQPVVLRMLDVHRTLLEAWGVCLIYPVNARVIRATVQKRFLEEGTVVAPYRQQYLAQASITQADTYLEKLFFRRIRPPEPSRQDLAKWLMQLLPEVAVFPGLLDFLRHSYYANPRYLKQFSGQLSRLVHRLRNATRGGLWDGLLDLNDFGLACKLLSKTVAFAMAGPFTGFYEPVRKPDPALLMTSELSAFDGSPLPFMVYNREKMIWEETVAPAPRILTDFLKSGPRLSDDYQATRSSFRAVESILPVSPFRWRSSTQLERVTTEEPGKIQESVPVSASDREVVQQLIGEWVASLEKTVRVPDQVRETLATPVTDPVVRVFGDANWEPSVRDLMQHAILYSSEGRFRDGMWLLNAAAVHEDWGEDEFRATLELLARRRQATAEPVLVFVDFGQARLGESDEILISASQALLRFDDSRALRHALNGFLRVLHITPDDLANQSIEIKDRLDEGVYLAALLGALDVLGKLEEFDRELALATAAVRTPTGVKNGHVVRNLARALRRSGRDLDTVLRVYDAAISLSGDEVMAVAWTISHVDEAQDVLTRLMACVDRNPGDPEFPGEVGVKLHNSGHVREATQWLEYSVYLDPSRQGNRRALAQNLLRYRGSHEAEKALDPSYVPEVDETEIRLEATQAHRELIKRIISQGRIEYEEMVLFDPAVPPEWIKERFPELL